MDGYTAYALMRNFSGLHQEQFQLALLQRPLIGSIGLCLNNALLSRYNLQPSGTRLLDLHRRYRSRVRLEV
jgi:hypothetical protein